MRRSISLLVISGLLPIVALGGVFGFVALRAQQTTVRSGLSALVQFSASLGSTKLFDGKRGVMMIAQSPVFDGALDAESFRLLATRLRDHQSAWRILSVADPDGHRLIDVPTPVSGVTKGTVVDLESFKWAVRTQQPVVGDVTLGPRGNHAFAIRAPVVRDGRVRYVLSAVISAETIRPLLHFRSLPEGWRAAIIDGSGNLVTSSAPDAGAVTNRLSKQGFEARRSGKQGFYEYDRADGSKAIATWAPIAGTNWSAHVSAPTASYTEAASGALILLVGVVALCLLLLGVLIRLLLAELRQDSARAEVEIQRQRMEALGQLTGGVAHDFNNLLTPILGGLELTRMRVEADEKACRYIDAAIAGAERARALVSRLLAFARRQALSVSEVDVHDLLLGLHDLLDRSVGPGANVKLSLPEEPLTVMADRTQLELSILNLAINARDAMPGGGVIDIAAKVIGDPPELPPGPYVAFTVSDTGVGMDAETLRRAVDPFFTTKVVGKGTGLGLSMVHGFAAQSGGVLRLASRVGHGTTVTIIMPMLSAPQRAKTPLPQALPEKPGHVLLVDDDESARSTIAEMLMGAGYEVVQASSVNEALEELAADRSFGVVITDYYMPGANGADLIREMRRTGFEMPVLLVTGYAEGGVDVPGAVPRLAKPFRSSELLEKLALIRATA